MKICGVHVVLWITTDGWKCVSTHHFVAHEWKRIQFSFKSQTALYEIKSIDVDWLMSNLLPLEKLFSEAKPRKNRNYACCPSFQRNISTRFIKFSKYCQNTRLTLEKSIKRHVDHFTHNNINKKSNDFSVLSYKTAILLGLQSCFSDFCDCCIDNRMKNQQVSTRRRPDRWNVV